MTYEDLDRAHLWHPFTPMRQWLGEPPLVIERAEGNELIDTEGRRYLDGVSSLWVNVHGHRHPHIDAAIKAQLDKVAHSTLLGLASAASARLAEKLVAVAPAGLSRVFFSDSGSTAVEVALKIAFQFHQLRGDVRRTKFLALENAYHGDTLGAVSVGGIDNFQRVFHPLLFHTIRVPPVLDALRYLLAAHSKDLCALILEPLVQGAAGMRLLPPGLAAGAQAACREHGVLLIADEVATGFGRTGTMFACQQEGVTPDLLAVAKGLSGGYLPVAATLCTEQVFAQFLGAPEERLTFFHGHSFGGNTLGCAAALASLELFESERTLEKLPEKIAALRARLFEKIAPLPHVFEVRQKGMMVGIELRRDRTHPYAPSDAVGARACRLARLHGLILRPLGDVVVLMPPLSISLPQIEKLVDGTAAAIGEATSTSHVESPPRVPSPPPIRPSRGVFVAGTDTAVGKTAVACALLRCARRRGFVPVGFKPVETGCSPLPQDALALRAAAGRDDLALSDVCPYPLVPSLAPAAAALVTGSALVRGDLLACAARVRARGDFFVVEGAGGLLSPYTPDTTAADLAAALDLPVLLVARNGLGTINHTALAVAELRRRGLALAGVVLVDTTAEASPDRAHNAHFIEAATGVRPLCTLGHVPARDPDALADEFERRIDVGALLASLAAR